MSCTWLKRINVFVCLFCLTSKCSRKHFCLTEPNKEVTQKRLISMLHSTQILCIWAHCRFGNFRVRFIFAKRVKRHICDIKILRLGHDLPISVIDRLISSFRKGYIFTKLRIHEVLQKINPPENFQIYSNLVWVWCLNYIKNINSQNYQSSKTRMPFFCFYKYVNFHSSKNICDCQPLKLISIVCERFPYLDIQLDNTPIVLK